ncbi:MAG TPA: GNAT family N-acetyltransferase [Bacteroidales bacterium]|nr:GNAT family N-acetyltransferase [Bacteroidales bacterium]
MSNYQHLKWDSDFFGFKVAAVYANEINNNEIDSILKKLHNYNYKLIYVISESELVFPNIKCLYNINFVDIKLTFKAFVNTIIEQNKDEDLINILKYSQKPINENLEELAYQSGNYSRFKLDKNFEPYHFFSLYKIWLQKSLSKEIADEVFVYTENDNILGFVTVSLNENNFGKIGLIAVEQNTRGKGIGRKLIKAVANYLLDYQINKLFVSTQHANKNACNFYQKLGFILDKKEYYYHLWIV